MSAFCDSCIRNQQLVISMLSECNDDDDYEEHRSQLEARYPLVCAVCEPHVKAKLQSIQKHIHKQYGTIHKYSNAVEPSTNSHSFGLLMLHSCLNLLLIALLIFQLYCFHTIHTFSILSNALCLDWCSTLFHICWCLPPNIFTRPRIHFILVPKALSSLTAIALHCFSVYIPTIHIQHGLDLSGAFIGGSYALYLAATATLDFIRRFRRVLKKKDVSNRSTNPSSFNTHQQQQPNNNNHADDIALESDTLFESLNIDDEAECDVVEIGVNSVMDWESTVTRPKQQQQHSGVFHVPQINGPIPWYMERRHAGSVNPNNASSFDSVYKQRSIYAKGDRDADELNVRVVYSYDFVIASN